MSELRLIPLSADTSEELGKRCHELSSYVEGASEVSITDLSYTLATREPHGAQRLAFLAANRTDVLAALARLAAGESHPDTVAGQVTTTPARRVAYVFSGGGTHWYGMGRELLGASRTFRESMRSCDDLIRRITGWSVIDELLATPERSKLARADVNQPALWALQVSLAQVWIALGVAPDAVVGHSLGEVAASCVAGGLSLEDGASVACDRSRVVQRMADHSSAMMAVGLSEAELAPRLTAHRGELTVAAVNGPMTSVVAGAATAMRAFELELSRDRIPRYPVDVDHAGHSAQMDPLLAPVREALGHIRPRPFEIALRSTTWGGALNPRVDANYWADNLRNKVMFLPTVDGLLADGFTTFVEIGAHNVLSAAIERTALDRRVPVEVCGSLRNGRSDVRCVLRAAAQLFAHGATLTFDSLFPDEVRAIEAPLWTHDVPAGPHRRPRSMPSAVAPAGPVERMIFEEFADVLRIPVTELRADRYLGEFGLDSMRAVQLRDRVRARFGQAIPLRALLDGTTLRGLVDLAAGTIPSDTGYVARAVGPTDGHSYSSLPDELSEPEAADLLAALTTVEAPAVPEEPSTTAPHSGELTARERLRQFLGQHQDFQLAPASHGQAGIWFVHQLRPDSPAYNTMLAAQVPEAVDESALRAAVRALVRKHPTLRTVFVSAGGKVYQRVLDEPLHEFETVDAAAFDDDTLRRAVVERAHRPLDLSRGPIFRVTLFSSGPREHHLVIAVHHIAVDGMSIEVLLRDLQFLYHLALQGQPEPVEPGAPFLPFVQWERHWLSSPAAAESLRWWSRLLEDPPKYFELPKLARAGKPANRDVLPPRPSTQTFAGDEYTFRWPADEVRGLKELARRYAVSLHTLVLTGIFTTMHRVTDATDLVLATAAARRLLPGSESAVGYYLNMVLLRAKPSAGKSFGTLLREVHEVSLGALEHSDHPLRLLTQQLNPPRQPGRPPWTGFVLSWLPGESATLTKGMVLDARQADPRPAGPLPLVPVPLRRRIARFDVDLTMGEIEGEIAGQIQYNTDVLDHETIATFTERLRQVLGQAAADPDLPMGRIPLLAPDERAIVMEQWNPPADAVRDKTLHGGFVAWAKSSPESPAIYHAQGVLTYGELDRWSASLAERLRDAGVGAGDRVGVCVERTPALVAALFAVLRAGACYVPLDADYPPERLRFMIDDSQVALIVTTTAVRDRCPDGLPLMVLDTDGRSDLVHGDRVSGDRAGAVAENGAAYMIYTSGSTGRPKGLTISHSGCAIMLNAMDAMFDGGEETVVAAASSICFDMSVLEIFVPLARGGAIVLVESAMHLPESPHLHRITQLNAVPSVMWALIKMGRLPSELRAVLLGGEAVRRELVDRVYAEPNVEKVFNAYGATEGSVFFTSALIPRDDPHQPTVGRPVPCARVYLLDENHQPVPPYHPGELYFAGAGLTSGYHNRPRLTAERFVPDPFHPGERMYRTGDLARFLSDGEIEFLGRVDDQVKIRGYRIEPEEIEMTLSRCAEVQQAVVRASPPADGRTGPARLVAYVVPAVEQAALPAEPMVDRPRQRRITRVLRETLPGHMVPDEMVFVPALPLAPGGKVDRDALPAVPVERTSAHREQYATTKERTLADIWGDLLNLPPESIGPHDSFYELGGSSLLLADLVARITSAFPRQVTISDLLRFSDIRSLAEWLENGNDDDSPLVAQGTERGSARRSAISARRGLRSRSSTHIEKRSRDE